MACPIFVTSAKADHKILNRFLLHLRNWEDNNDPGRIITLCNPLSIWPDEPDGTFQLQSTEPPVSATFANGWDGAEISEINTFMLDNAPDPPGSVHMILDDKGIEDGTVIVAEQRYNDEAEEKTKDFNKMRVPWQEAGCVRANLDIANVGFEEYCDQEKGADEDGFWDYNVGDADIASEEDKAKRDGEIEKWETEGLV